MYYLLAAFSPSQQVYNLWQLNLLLGLGRRQLSDKQRLVSLACSDSFCSLFLLSNTSVFKFVFDALLPSL